MLEIVLVQFLDLDVCDSEPSDLNVLNNQAHVLVHSLWLYNSKGSVKEFVQINLGITVRISHNLKLPCIDSHSRSYKQIRCLYVVQLSPL